MKVFGLAGWSGSGKTTLTVKLIPALKRRGLTVSTIKHAHHAFDVDTPGKDSYEHRLAGAEEVLVGSAQRWALMREHRGAPEPALPELLARLAPVDLVLVEGFKNEALPKLEIWRRAVGKPLRAPGDPQIVAVASDGPVPETDRPVLPLDDVEAIADFVVAACGLADKAALDEAEGAA
jgi:molybdopterin-guanine dinucleotide biosynthesis protein B